MRYITAITARIRPTSASRNTQGTFIIDMVDPDENASAWRSVTQSKLNDATIRDQAALDSAAMRELAGFPHGAMPASP